MLEISKTLRGAALELCEEIESGSWGRTRLRMEEVAEDLAILAEQLELVAEADERQLMAMRAARAAAE